MCNELINNPEFNELVLKCIRTEWLGYGNLNAPIWFLGTEEGGAEFMEGSFPNHEKLIKSLENISSYTTTISFKSTWVNRLGSTENITKRIKKPTVWEWVSYFIRTIYNTDGNFDVTEWRKNIFSDLSNSDFCFMGEFYPLPKPKKSSIFPYTLWKNVQEYHDRVQPIRAEKIMKAIKESAGVKLIICYERDLGIFLRNHFNYDAAESIFYKSRIKQREFEFTKHTLNGKSFGLLTTPFFTRHKINRNDIDEVINELRLKSTFF